MFQSFLYVGLGSALGGIARFGLGKMMQNLSLSSLPIATLAANVLGCLIIGALYALFERGNVMSAELRLFLTVGFCGGFTTFSTFMNENYSFIQSGNLLLSLTYATASLVLGFLALYIGNYIVRII